MSQDVTAQVKWFHPSLIQAYTRVCCPACGHIIGGRMKWEHPPVSETQRPIGGKVETVFVGQVLAECPDCKSYFIQTEVMAYDEATVKNFISKASP